MGTAGRKKKKKLIKYIICQFNSKIYLKKNCIFIWSFICVFYEYIDANRDLLFTPSELSLTNGVNFMKSSSILFVVCTTDPKGILVFY